MASSSSVEDRINLHQLMELKAAFERADLDNGGSLDMEEFLEAFGGVLGKNLAKKQLMHLFMKIDANSDGSVDWDEFTNFMLLENQAAADMTERNFQARYVELEQQPIELNPKGALHKDMIEGLLPLPKQDKLLTHSRDGTVRAWGASNMQHLRTLKVSDSWVTDCKYFAQSNRIGVTCIDRTVAFYDSSTYEPAGHLTGLDTSPLCLGSWNDLGREKMLLGDDVGNITLYDVGAERHDGADTPMAAPNVRLYREKRHSDWVTKVCYYPVPNFMVSSSLDGTLKLGELERRARFLRQLGEDKSKSSAQGAAKKGLYSFDWSNNFKVLASCGLERSISLWNPYVRSGKPLTMLQGHCSSVMSVVINDANNQLISCSVDKYIKVWDMRNYKCLQTLIDKTYYRPENKISAMAFDPDRRNLLTATATIKVWPMVKITKKSIHSGHDAPLCAALYNRNFHQVVSGDEGAQVCVWDVETGDMVFNFAELHSAKMTAMAFDEAGRRLITGGNDGTVRMWNFSNGQCLKELQTGSHQEVSSVLFILEGQNKLIVAGGWSRKVLVWRDDSSSTAVSVEADRKLAGHTEDIISIAFSSPNLLATSGYDGRILVWNLDSGIAKFTLAIPNLRELEIDQRAIWQLLFLDSRSQALCAVGADGYMRFWNVKEGVLAWEQHARHGKGESVVALATDATNSFLYTGDSAGNLKMWDIHLFLNVAGLKQDKAIEELQYWRAHSASITSLDYIERHELLLTASSDSKIKMWHVNPERVTLAGVFGDGSAWDLNDSSSFRLVKSEPSPNLETSDDTTVSESAASVEARTRTKTKAESARAAEAAAARSNDEPGAEGDGSVPPSDGEDERPESEKDGESFAPSVGNANLAEDDASNEHSTKDMILSILNRNASKDPMRRTPPVPTMHRLRLHGLSEIPPSPRGNTPR